MKVETEMRNETVYHKNVVLTLSGAEARCLYNAATVKRVPREGTLHSIVVELCRAIEKVEAYNCEHTTCAKCRAL